MASLPIVLLVEDQPQIARMIQRQLDGEFQIVIAPDAAQALEIAKGRTDIDGVISDLDLGAGDNGVDVLEWFRLNRPKIPRLLLSASVPDDLGPLMVSGSIQRYVAKPPAKGELQGALRELLGKSS